MLGGHQYSIDNPTPGIPHSPMTKLKNERMNEVSSRVEWSAEWNG
jgi:hypothetical protein